MRIAGLGLLLSILACSGNAPPTPAPTPVVSSPIASVAVTQSTPSQVVVDLGDVPVGGTRTVALALASPGATLAVEGLSPPQPENPIFSLVLPLGNSITKPGTSLQVSFSPTSLGVQVAAWTVATSSIAVPALTITLRGNGVGLGLTVTPNPADFGDRVVVNTQKPVGVQVTNTLAETVILSATALSGPDATLFSVDEGLDGKVLASGASAIVNAYYNPVAVTAGDVQDTASFELSICPGCPGITVALEGGSMASALLVAPMPLDFGFVQPGGTVTVVLTVQNVGTQILNLTSAPEVLFEPTVSQTGESRPFAVGSDATTPPSFPYPLGMGATVDFPIVFTPTSLDEFEGSFSLSSDAEGQGSAVVNLHGFGGGGILSCSPLSVSFGAVATQSTAVRQVQCGNTGTDVPGHPEATLQLTQAALISSLAAFSATLPTAAVTLTAGQAVQIPVAYTPPGPENDTATLSIGSNANAQLIALSGLGIEPEACTLSISPANLDFGEVPPGQAATQDLTLTNVGAGFCVIEGLALDPASDARFSVTNGSLGSQLLDFPGDAAFTGLATSVTVEVTFTGTGGAPAASGAVVLTVQKTAQPAQQVRLQATSMPGCLTVTPDGDDFGSVVENSTTRHWCSVGPQTIRIANTCSTAVTLSGITVDPQADAVAQFGLGSLPTFPSLLAVGAELDLPVELSPTGVGVKQEALAIATTEFVPTVAYRVGLSGTAGVSGTRTDTFTATMGQTSFVVETTPDTMTLAVSVNGVPVPEAGNWQYVAASGAVVFTAGSAALPAAGDIVAISYGETCDD